jgi:glycosyltransferase involved in cell wall biosynthesis
MSQITLASDNPDSGTPQLAIRQSEKIGVIHVPRRFVRNEWGGTETTILETSRAFNARGHHSSIVTTTAMCDQKHESIQGVKIHRHKYVYPFLGLSRQDKRDMDRKGGNLLSISMLKTLLSAPDLDIMHAHSGKRLGGIVRTAARIRKLPYVISLHGGVIDVPSAERQQLLEPLKGTFEWGKAFGAMLGARRVLEDASAILCVGENEQRAVQKKYPDQRVEWLPNGVNSEDFAIGDGRYFREKNGIPHNRHLVLSVGRIDPQKNQLALLSAMSELLYRRHDVHLVLIGPVTVEAYGRELLDKINSAALHNNVTVLPGLPGGSKELVDAFHAADVFCLPSRHEPFGIVVLEAWAAGLPVVASRVGGIPSFTTDGDDVLHADPGIPQSFAAAIENLLLDRELAGKIAATGRHKARSQFDWCRIADRLESIYQDILRT